MAPLPVPAPDPPQRANGLLAATVRSDGAPFASQSFVDDLDADAVRRVRQDALAMRARYGRPVTIDVRFVSTPDSERLIATLDDLAAHGIRVARTAIAPLAPTTAPVVDAHAIGAPAGSDAPARSEAHAAAQARSSSSEREEKPAPVHARPLAFQSPDPFGIDSAFRRGWLQALRVLFDRYWRVEVSGIEHVPDVGPALIAANHSGAVPADAFMLGVALEVRQPPRSLRVLYDRFVDALPLIGPLYRRLGAVPASFANAEILLSRGEVVGLFPEGIAGVEKRFTERYRLRPFKTGTARMSLRTGAPIVPVAIVGAEEAYPVVARLYRLGRAAGLPWVPVTPLFPLCGLAGAIPLPTKWHMHFCAPIYPPAAAGRAEEELVTELTERLRAAITTGVGDLLAKRQGIFV
jgi:1-acyl-sn-glycerol-3-phosphate acyltransferase